MEASAEVVECDHSPLSGSSRQPGPKPLECTLLYEHTAIQNPLNNAEPHLMSNAEPHLMAPRINSVAW